MKNIFIPFKLDEANPEGGGGGGGNNTPDPKNTPTEAEKERDRLLAENAELRKKQKEQETSVTSIREELAALKRAGHKTNGDWQKVAEEFEAKATTAEEKLKQHSQAFVNTLTSAKIREEALKQGAKGDMVDLIDGMEFSEIEAEIDDKNRFNVKGVETAIANLKKLRPSLFDAKAAPKFDGRNPGTPATPGTLEDKKKVYLEAMKNRHRDPAKYQAAHLDYQKAIIEGRKAAKN